MRFKVRMAERAEADLGEIYDYLAINASTKQARAYVAFLRLLDSLTCSPNVARSATIYAKGSESSASNDVFRSPSPSKPTLS